MGVPYTFGTATTSIPLSQLDANFNTPVTLGNTTVGLGNTVTTVGNLTLTNATISSGTVTVTSISDSGNLTFTGTGNRITGDMTNATLANRVAFQTSTANTTTILSVIPNGTGTASALQLYNNSSDLANSSVADLRVSGTTDVRLQATFNGTGTQLPLTMYTGGSERLRIDTSGNVGIGTSSPATKLDVRGNALFGANGRILLTESSGDAIIGGAAGTNFTDMYVNGALNTRFNLSGSLVLKGGATGATGTGIAFPATQSASSDANTLDDYEEGTWTPTDASGAGLTFANVNAQYTKVGRWVYAIATFDFPSTANGSTASIGGLPFTVGSTSGHLGGFITQCTVAAALRFRPANGATQGDIRNSTSVAQTNATLSSCNITINAIYFV